MGQIRITKVDFITSWRWGLIRSAFSMNLISSDKRVGAIFWLVVHSRNKAVEISRRTDGSGSSRTSRDNHDEKFLDDKSLWLTTGVEFDHETRRAMAKCTTWNQWKNKIRKLGGKAIQNLGYVKTKTLLELVPRIRFCNGWVHVVKTFPSGCYRNVAWPHRRSSTRAWSENMREKTVHE